MSGIGPRGEGIAVSNRKKLLVAVVVLALGAVGCGTRVNKVAFFKSLAAQAAQGGNAGGSTTGGATTGATTTGGTTTGGTTTGGTTTGGTTTGGTTGAVNNGGGASAAALGVS